jgi:hypothetical protein
MVILFLSLVSRESLQGFLEAENGNLVLSKVWRTASSENQQRAVRAVSKLFVIFQNFAKLRWISLDLPKFSGIFRLGQAQKAASL